MGIRVIAIDGGDEKRELCTKLGAEAYIDFQKAKAPADLKEEIMKITKHGAHGVIVTAASKTVYEWAPMYLRPGGTVVAVGLPSDPTILAGAPPLIMALRKLNIVGNITGTMKDVEEALDFTARDIVHVSCTRNCCSISVILTVGTADSLQGKVRGSRLVGREVEDGSSGRSCCFAGSRIGDRCKLHLALDLAYPNDILSRTDCSTAMNDECNSSRY
jgi:D-arabinose 1-dehydrogenase-like Zn-dependent alcohol dehydrogenase